MRFSPSILFLAIAVMSSASSAARADDESFQVARINAHRALAIAKMDLRMYEQVEYPRQRRDLNARITLNEEEIKLLKWRIREYDPFNRFSTGQPLSYTLQETRMCLLAAELLQRDLWAERNALMRFHGDQWRLLAFNVQEARAQVIALEGGGSIAINEPAAAAQR